MGAVIYIMDDINYRGGAHVATLLQIRCLLRAGVFPVTVITLASPGRDVSVALAGAKIITPQTVGAGEELGVHPDKLGAHPEKLRAALLATVTAEDIVCVPFENSAFRAQVARLRCKRKIQWFHIDYANWRLVNEETRQVSCRDGEIYPAFDQLVFVSKAGMEGFARLYPHLAGKCRVCRNLMDTGEILQKGAKPLPPLWARDGAGGAAKRPRLVTVARLDNTQKAIGRSLLAADWLAKAGYDFEWMFVGDGAERPVFEDMVQRLGLEGRVRFAGHQQNPWKFVRDADVFCLFSFYEGIPNTVFEAQILGTPPIAVCMSGTGEQIEEDKTGWLVENSLQGIYKGLKRLLDEPARLAEVRKNLESYRYDNEAVEREVLRIFAGEAPAGPDAALPAAPAGVELVVWPRGDAPAQRETLEEALEAAQAANAEYVVFAQQGYQPQPQLPAAMYAAALAENADIVVGALLPAGENTPQAAPFDGGGLLPMDELMKASLGPVLGSPVGKLVRRRLLAEVVAALPPAAPGVAVPARGMIPLLYAKAKTVWNCPEIVWPCGAVAVGPGLQDEIAGWRQVLAHVPEAWQAEAAFAVYGRACAALEAAPEAGPGEPPEALAAATEVTEFLRENAAWFAFIPYIKDVQAGNLAPWLEAGRVPRRVVYAPKVEPATLEQWKRMLPGYAFAPLADENPYMELARRGGVYLAAGVVLQKPLDSLLCLPAFFAMQSYAEVGTHVFGSEAGNPLLLRLARAAEGQPLVAPRLTRILEEECGFCRTGRRQVLDGGTAVLPVNMLAADVGDGACIAALETGDKEQRRMAKESFFVYPVLAACAVQQPAVPLERRALPGTPEQVVDAAIQKYGKGLVLRQLAKALLKKILPGGLYSAIEKKALGG